MERAVFSKSAALGTLRDRPTLFANVKQGPIVMCAISGTVSANAVVTEVREICNSEIGDSTYQANL
jgi:hypothetical protein